MAVLAVDTTPHASFTSRERARMPGKVSWVTWGPPQLSPAGRGGIAVVVVLPLGQELRKRALRRIRRLG
jgi:hypothetical protein